MKPIFFTLLFIIPAFTIKAQDHSIPSPNTETALLNYDFRLQRSGYEQVDAKMIYSYLNQPLKLYFNVDSTYDFMFVAIADSATEGLKASCFFENESSPYLISDESQLIKEFNSKITIIPLNSENRVGLVTLQLDLLGKLDAKEPSYYLMMRKKRK